MRKAFEIGFGRTEQEIAVDSLPVQGQIPKWVHGELFRNGPGTFQVGEQHYRHWFDGLAMLHKFSIQNGAVSYANKFLESHAYNEAMENGYITYQEFATDPCHSLFGRVKSVFSPKITDSAKVNIAKIAENYVALSETPMQIEFDPETLKSVGVRNYDKHPRMHTTTVHPQFDAEHNEVYNLVTRFNRVSHYRFMRMENDWQPQLAAITPVKEPAYIHSFGLSKHYIILAEFPLVVQPLALLLQLKPFIENYKWKPKRGTRWFVFDRRSGELVKQTKSEAFFAFHHVNAFERGDDLIVDMVTYPDNQIINSFYLKAIAEESATLPGGRLKRFTLNLKKENAVSEELLSDEWIELPRFDSDTLNMDGSYRYVYATGINKEAPLSFYNQIVKLDIGKRQAKSWFQEGCYPGEPVFVGRPGRTQEDDGVVFTVVLDEHKGNSFLLVLDASSFQEIARAEIPHAILFGYHGAFF
mgnify:CR=1 FL=1